MGRVSVASGFRSWRWEGREIVALRGGIPISDRGFRYGEHLFESLAVRNGRVLLAREHLALLDEAARRNGFPFARALRTALAQFCKGEGARLSDGMLRIYLTAGEGGPASPVTAPDCYLAWERTHFPSDAEREAGYSLVTLPGRATARWGEKSGNYLAHCDALREARALGADEGLVTGDRGEVVSCATGNVIVWLKRGNRVKAFTPSPSSGARMGALLGWVRTVADVGERSLGAEDLSRAMAMAVTNSRLGVMPVARLDGRDLPDSSRPLGLSRLFTKSHGCDAGKSAGKSSAKRSPR